MPWHRVSPFWRFRQIHSKFRTRMHFVDSTASRRAVCKQLGSCRVDGSAKMLLLIAPLCRTLKSSVPSDVRGGATRINWTIFMGSISRRSRRNLCTVSCALSERWPQFAYLPVGGQEQTLPFQCFHKHCGFSGATDIIDGTYRLIKIPGELLTREHPCTGSSSSQNV